MLNSTGLSNENRILCDDVNSATITMSVCVCVFSSSKNSTHDHRTSDYSFMINNSGESKL